MLTLQGVLCKLWRLFQLSKRLQKVPTLGDYKQRDRMHFFSLLPQDPWYQTGPEMRQRHNMQRWSHVDWRMLTRNLNRKSCVIWLVQSIGPLLRGPWWPKRWSQRNISRAWPVNTFYLFLNILMMVCSNEYPFTLMICTPFHIIL